VADLDPGRPAIPAPGVQLSVAEYSRQARQIAAAPDEPGVTPLRVALLGSCTLQFVEPFLSVEGMRQRLRVRSHYGPFGQFEQQIADAASPLHAFDPEALVLLMRPEDVDPDTYARYYAEHRTGSTLERIVDRLVECVERFRERSNAPVLVANFAMPANPPLGLFDANAADSATHAIAAANVELRARLAKLPAAFVWDYAGLVRDCGTQGWTDPRLWALGRIAVATDRQPLLARHLARSLGALVRPPSKCLVLDLDNTLWGGVIGDDGMEGIRLGDDYPGSVFKSFQRAVLGLADRGILLAVVSKNDAVVAEQALREHPEMLIRPDHLSAVRINWNPKSANLRGIAEELNIGADALVLFDDNPVERAEVAANAPEVRVVDVPSDPLGYERALADCGLFDAPVLSSEDRQRVQMYRQERARETTRDSAATVEDFLGDLQMVAQVGRIDDANLGRVAQLVGKTNQFNLTTRRHAQADIARMAQDDTHAVLWLRLADRFGDLGLIAVGILTLDGEDAVIDSFVMSCRAMGRRAEVALAAELVEAARALGARRIVGDYLPTPRNGIVAELYATLGFERIAELEGGGTRFALDLTSAKVEWPGAIRRFASVGSMPTPA
jgi:FkbH-like protein